MCGGAGVVARVAMKWIYLCIVCGFFYQMAPEVALFFFFSLLALSRPINFFLSLSGKCGSSVCNGGFLFAFPSQLLLRRCWNCVIGPPRHSFLCTVFYINVGVDVFDDDNNMRWCIVTNGIKKKTRLCVSKVIYFFGQLTIS